MSTRPGEEDLDNPVFLDVLLSMNTAEMAQIPEDRWPQRLSKALLHKLPENKRRIVARVLKLRAPAGAAGSTGADHPQVAALRELEPGLIGWMSATESELDDAESNLQRWRDLTALQNRHRAGARPGSGEVDLSPELDEDPDRLFDLCIEQGAGLALHLNSRRLELTRFAQAMHGAARALKQRKAPVLAAELAGAGRLFGKLRHTASRYYLLRLNLVWMEMDRARRTIGQCESTKRQLGQDIEQVHQKLNQARNWKARLTGRTSSDQIQALHDMMASLQQDRENCVYQVPAEEMRGWLNAVVDAYLDAHCSEIARSQINKSIRLFMDLARYRRQVSRQSAFSSETAATHRPAPIDDRKLIGGCIDGHRPDIWQSLQLGEKAIAERLAELRDRLIRDYTLSTAQRYAVPL